MHELMEGSKQPKTSWQVWWKLLRPHTLTAGFIPVVIGTALAMQLGDINFLLFAAMLIASLLIQSATNMFNEYYDYKRGLDTADSVGIGGAIVREGIDAKFVLKLAFIFFGAALALGIYICINSSWWIGAIGVVSMAAGYFYTGGPYPIAYSPFGELVAGLFMGLIIILIAFYIQTETITLESILISIPISILCGAILTANNIRDLEGDKINGRRTIAILLGHNHSIWFLAAMFIVSYFWIIGMIVFVSSSIFLLLAFLSIPKALEAVKGFVGKKKPIEMMPAMKATAQTHTSFGFLIAAGLLLSYFI
jgi:1,4-dihydroxy-2-naphthoate polyprenyltransferase